MVFITTGQRIATENFEEGKIYKVVLINGNTVYFMCTGIGTDFVMLQSDEPRLFALTMQSAAQVSTIDLYDPTPPAPPTPISNCLQYQTGAPPFNFRTTESKLFSWYIAGPAGDRTANLFNYKTATTQKGTFDSNGVFHATDNDDRNTLIYKIQLYSGNSSIQASTKAITVTETGTYRLTTQTKVTSSVTRVRFANNGNSSEFSIFCDIDAVALDDEYISIVFTVDDITIGASVISNIMFYKGSTALDYEPYGYKISIQTNSRTDTIYLDSPLAEGEKLYSVNTDTEIITTIGDNSLSITTPTQPPEMQIVYGIYAEA